MTTFSEYWTYNVIKGLHDENLALHLRVQELEADRRKLEAERADLKERLSDAVDRLANFWANVQA